MNNDEVKHNNETWSHKPSHLFIYSCSTCNMTQTLTQQPGKGKLHSFHRANISYRHLSSQPQFFFLLCKQYYSSVLNKQGHFNKLALGNTAKWINLEIQSKKDMLYFCIILEVLFSKARNIFGVIERTSF